MGIKNFFQVSPNNPLNRRALSQKGSSSASQVCVAIEFHTLHEQQNVKKKRQIIPEKIKKSVVFRAWKYGIPAARRWATKIYSDHKYARETVRDWKARYQTFFNKSIRSTEGSPVLFSPPRLGKPRILSDDLTTEIRLILNNFRKLVISVGNGVYAANCPKKLRTNRHVTYWNLWIG